MTTTLRTNQPIYRNHTSKYSAPTLPTAKELTTGSIWFCDLGNEKLPALQAGVRPCLVVQNEMGCIHSPRVWVFPLTSKTEKAKTKRLPMHVFIPKSETNNLWEDSVILVEQARNVLKSDFINYIGECESHHIEQCSQAAILNWGIFTPQSAQSA